MSKVAQTIIRRFYPAALDPTQLTPMRIIAPDLLFCFILAVAAWVMSKIEGRRLGQYGLPASEALGKNFRVGLCRPRATSGTVLSIFALHGVRFTSAVAPWHRDFDCGGRLGAGIFAFRLGRGIFVSRILAVHADDWDGILAVRILALGFIRAGSRHQRWRKPFGMYRWFRSVCCCACFSAGLEIYGVRLAYTWDMTGVTRSRTVFQIVAYYPRRVFSTHV